MNYAFLVSFNDVSSNLPALPDGSEPSGTAISNLFDSLNSSINSFVQSLREGVNGIYSFINGIDHVSESLNSLVETNTLPVGTNFVNFNDYIGNVRFVIGDLVFTEIYILLMIGASLFLFQVVMKVISALSYIIKSIMHIPFLNNKFGGIGSALKSFFH